LRENAAFRLSSSTDPNGRYGIAGIPAGRQYLEAGENRTQPMASIAIDVPESGQMVRDIVLQPGTVSGIAVKASDRSPVAGLALYLLDRRRFPTDDSPVPRDVSLGGLHARTDGAGRFRFEGVGPGSYGVSAYSDTLGNAWVFADVAPGQVVENLVLTVGDVGSLLVRAISTETGAELHLGGGISLIDGQNRLVMRYLLTPQRERARTPATVEGLTAGSYAVGAMLEDAQQTHYVSPASTRVEIVAGRQQEVVLPMSRAVLLKARVFDEAGKPVTGFRAAFYNATNAFLATGSVEGNEITATVPAGRVRVVLSRANSTLFDGCAGPSRRSADRCRERHIRQVTDWRLDSPSPPS